MNKITTVSVIQQTFHSVRTLINELIKKLFQLRFDTCNSGNEGGTLQNEIFVQLHHQFGAAFKTCDFWTNFHHRLSLFLIQFSVPNNDESISTNRFL